MNPFLAAGYEGVARLARALVRVVPDRPGAGKVSSTFVARRGVLDRYRAFQRDHARQLLWMHAPSVGEGLQARPVLELVRRRSPEIQLAYSWFSPSAASFAARLDVDFRDVLPFDAASDMRAIVRALAPSALVFSKLDVWPTLGREASRAGVPLGLISATLAEGSSRRGAVAGALLRDAYARLSRVGAISAEDADRLVALGVPPSRVSVTGDARYDQVWERAARADMTGPLLAPLAGPRPTLVAGSTWPADEAVLLPAWASIAARHRDVRLVIAPHEPTETHLQPVEAWARGAGLSIARLSDPASRTADVVLVDSLGVLGDLYALATLAFVGGGFHAAGLHSVLEPASFGVATLFGPRHQGSRDARLLLDADGAVALENVREAEVTLESWARHDPDWSLAGEAARRVVHAGLGAAERSWALVMELMGGAR